MTNVVPFTTRLEQERQHKREGAELYFRGVTNHEELAKTPLGKHVAMLVDEMKKNNWERGR